MTPTTSSYIQLTRSRLTRRYHIRIKGGNHKIRLVSQPYYSKSNALRAAHQLCDETGMALLTGGIS